MHDRWSRRRCLRSIGAVAAGGLAGCAAPTGSQSDVTDDAESVYTRVYRDAIDSVVLIRAFTSLGTGQGSGFVLRDGRVLTNQHVVEGATELELRFSDGEWRSGEIVGADVYSDLAVIRVEDPPADAAPLRLLDGDPAIGQEVVALGSPFGLERSLSTGVVSGVNRTIPTEAGFTIPDAIQTDAAVNPGNSGGPLLTLDREVAGCIRSGGGENIGFAISTALIRRVAPALIADGEYDHPFMGVLLTSVTPTVAEANDLDAPRGVLVVEVLPDGPADGVLQGSPGTATVNGVEIPTGGDVIRRLDDREITTLGDLSGYLALETSPGETMAVTVLRDGARERVDLTLGTRPPPGEL